MPRQRSPSGEVFPRRVPHAHAAEAASHGSWRRLALAALLPLSLSVLLFLSGAPLGKPGKLVYPYSPIFAYRLLAAIYTLPLALLLSCAIALLGRCEQWRRRLGAALIPVGVAGIVLWVYLAPPQYSYQHFFNMNSPAQDGAFLLEADEVRRVGLPAYLAGFAQRAARPPQELQGTRILSNPPGATVLAYGVTRMVDARPALASWLARTAPHEELPPDILRLSAHAFGYAMTLTLLWGLAAPFLYLAARAVLPTVPSAAFAVCTLISPMALLFTPGKDPAQLLSVALPLCLWLWADRRKSWTMACLAGAAFVMACVVGLVHVWVGLIVAAATVLSRASSPTRAPWLRLGLLITTAGLTLAGLRLFLGFDLLSATLAVARAQAQVTRGPEAMPFIWQALGLPLFLLFAGPALWWGLLSLTGEHVHDPDARFGCWLLIGSALVMLTTVGYTNMETPRLWIPFTPTLLLGALLQLRALRTPDRALTRFLAGLIFVQVVVAATQWGLMDMRETEHRLLADETGTAPLWFSPPDLESNR